MTDLPGILPIGIGLVAALFLAAVAVLMVRVSRRSARARAGARSARTDAEDVLLRLDDAVDDLDVAFEAVDARSADVPPELRRARNAVVRTRDRAFTEVSALRAPQRVPAEARADARRIRARLDDALREVGRTHEALTSWTSTRRSPDALVAAARARLASARDLVGDPSPLVDGLRERFDHADWADADAAAGAASAALSDAAEAIDAAALDPAGTLGHLMAAHRRVRAAERHVRTFEEAHRASMQASENAAVEVAALRAELDAARATAPSATVHDADRALAAVHVDRRPRAAVATVARLREDLDGALPAAPSAREQLEAARAALPGTLTCARVSLAVADGREDRGSLSERLRREQARRELAAARAATDPVSALVAARAAWSDAREAAGS